MEIHKLMEQVAQAIPGTTGEPNTEDLALIHGFTRRDLSAEELYVFKAFLCDNDIDRDGERFTRASLDALAALFVGVTGLFDHSCKSGDQVMRIYAAEVVELPDRTNRLGEPYAALCAKVYLLRGSENDALIRAIDGGIKKEVSVSCAVKYVRCSVCGKAFGREGCNHQKGKLYEGRLCHAVLEEPTDAYEFSFVAVPAQPAAGVTKKKRENESHTADVNKTAEVCAESPEQLRALADDGRMFRQQLLEHTVNAGVAAVGVRKELLRAMCVHLPAADLNVLCSAFEKQAAKTLPLQGQLFRNKTCGAEESNEGFRM